MARTTHILQRPPQFQWDRDSAPCKPTNCNCTCVAMIAGYYKDVHISPTTARRRMQAGSNVCGGTSNREAVRGLNSFGIPSTTSYLKMSQVKAKIEARIPVILDVDYGKIPNIRAYQTDFNFNGQHAVLAVDAGTAKDHRGRLVPGIWVRDPDHGSPARPERPQKTFWPDWVWGPAFKKSGIGMGVAVYPKAKKA